MSTTTKTITLGSYLIDRLHDLGVRHVFGVPGDFSLNFCKLLETDGRIAFVGTTREDTAGFAADGYARRNKGMGVVLVTHGVGALSTVNPIAGANAESSPVLLISGAPGVAERKRNPLIHHSFGSPEAQMKIFGEFHRVGRDAQRPVSRAAANRPGAAKYVDTKKTGIPGTAAGSHRPTRVSAGKKPRPCCSIHPKAIPTR